MNDELRLWTSNLALSSSKSCVLDPRVREDDGRVRLAAGINDQLPLFIIQYSSFIVKCLFPVFARMTGVKDNGWHQRLVAPPVFRLLSSVYPLYRRIISGIGIR